MSAMTPRDAANVVMSFKHVGLDRGPGSALRVLIDHARATSQPDISAWLNAQIEHSQGCYDRVVEFGGSPTNTYVDGHLQALRAVRDRLAGGR